jgi:hypothetical protein
MLMDALVLEVKDDGRRLEKMLTFRETAYLLGVFSSGAAMELSHERASV